MNLLHKMGAGLLMLLFPAATALAADAIQDLVISVNPVVLQFPITTLGAGSAPSLFTITNKGGAAISLGARTLGGVNASEFAMGSTTCGAFLTAGSSCTVEVSFRPSTKGTKSGTLEIQTGSAVTPVLTAFLTNSTSATVEAQRRMPAVLAALAIPDTMTGGQTYDMSWTIEGYDAAYSSFVALFDCTGISDGSCGDTYGSANMFAESPVVTNGTGSAGNWLYGGVRTKQFTYGWSYQVPANRIWAGSAPWAATPGNEIVVRIYQKNDIDAIRNNTFISLLLPGNQAATYYDKEGRRIVKYVVAP